MCGWSDFPYLRCWFGVWFHWNRDGIATICYNNHGMGDNPEYDGGTGKFVHRYLDCFLWEMVVKRTRICEHICMSFSYGFPLVLPRLLLVYPKVCREIGWWKPQFRIKKRYHRNYRDHHVIFKHLESRGYPRVSINYLFYRYELTINEWSSLMANESSTCLCM